MSSNPILIGRKKSPVKSEIELEKFEKPKPRISCGTAKKIIGRAVESYGALWIERWIDNWIRSNSMPPQLLSDDFPHLLPLLLSPTDALKAFEEVRRAFNHAFPLPLEASDTQLDWIVPILRADPIVYNEYPAILTG